MLVVCCALTAADDGVVFSTTRSGYRDYNALIWRS